MRLFVGLFFVFLTGMLGCQNQPSVTSMPDQSASDTETKPEPGLGTDATDSSHGQAPADSGQEDSGQTDSVDRENDSQSLFDGESLAGWEITNFGGEGDCFVEDGNLIVEMGSPMSGLTSLLDDLPTVNYEVSLAAKRLDGIDFFCCLTFPVKDSHCSFVVGGWAGAVVGLSNIDGKDAGDNETKLVMAFDDNRWYQVRVRVLENNISAWIDDKQVVDVDTTGRRIDLRNETLPSRPLGISTFETRSAFKDIRLRKLAPATRADDKK